MARTIISQGRCSETYLRVSRLTPVIHERVAVPTELLWACCPYGWNITRQRRWGLDSQQLTEPSAFTTYTVNEHSPNLSPTRRITVRRKLHDVRPIRLPNTVSGPFKRGDKRF